MQPNCCIGCCLEKFWLGFFHAERKQMRSLEPRRTVSEELIYCQLCSFLIYFLVKLLCVTFVDTKAVADDKYVYGICSVVCSEF